MRVILASTSKTRAELLANAGVAFETVASGVDEDAIKASLESEGARPAEIAEVLAEIKAVRVSERLGEGLVIGADQVLDLGGAVLSKPSSLTEARAHLESLSGRAHTLATAVVIAERGAAVWRHIARPRLLMRPLSASFVTDYLEAEGDNILSSVGAYRLEGRGAQLFTGIEGDYFSVLGLPLLPVLDYLRQRGVLPR